MHYPPQYVLDEMEVYEINAALKFSHLSYKDNWEQARLIAYMVAQVNSKKKLKFTDIVEFPWEAENEEINTEITKEDIDRLNKMAQEYLKKK